VEWARSPTIYTIGHGARPGHEFVQMLEQARVERVVDVRTAPGSRKHPQFGLAELASALESAGIAYVWRKDLGGWRKPRPDSRNMGLESAGFRGYADYMETEDFEQALSWLVKTSSGTLTAVMCAESLWWRCHRRMIADALFARGIEAFHLMAGGRKERHRLHPVARLDGPRVVYDRDEHDRSGAVVRGRLRLPEAR
jgi:uncharacterized protein (DUF488 family)